MNHWLSALVDQSEPAVLVTVAQVQGSAPRAAGTKMLITQTGLFDTIGGGHLELRAMQTARAMLALPAGTLAAERRLERFPLGPSLGQCCGGVVHLAFERIAPETKGHAQILKLRNDARQDSWRALALNST